MNPFGSLKQYLLTHFPAFHDVIVVGGKTAMALWLLLIVVMVLTAREVWVRFWRKDLSGEAFELNQAFAFLSLVIGLHAAYVLSPELSYMRVLTVSTAILIFVTSLALLRLLCARSHALMIKGDTMAGMRLGLYNVGAGVASHAVVTSAFSG